MLPGSDGLGGEFYAHAAAGTLHVQRCDTCRRWRHPPRIRCGGCGSALWSWQPVGGRGRLFTWTVTHRAADPAFAEHVPYVVAVVELDEGARVVGNIFGVDPPTLAHAHPVRVVLDRRSDSVALVDFEPA